MGMLTHMTKLAKRKKFRPKTLLLPAVLATSAYYSFAFMGGIVIGYLLCKAFCHVFLKSGKVESIFVDMGKRQLHLHHWIMGLMVLGIAWYIDFFYLPAFFAGVVCGVIIQDIYDYNDWHQVLVKNDE